MGQRSTPIQWLVNFRYEENAIKYHVGAQRRCAPTIMRNYRYKGKSNLLNKDD